MIGNRVQFEGGSQLRVLAQADPSLAKGLVLITHPAKHGQQLRLCKLPLAELRALRGQNNLTDFQSQAGKPHQSNLSHGECEGSRASFSLTPFCLAGTKTCRGCQQSHAESFDEIQLSLFYAY